MQLENGFRVMVDDRLNYCYSVGWFNPIGYFMGGWVGG